MSTEPQLQNTRDVVVVGASAGGVESLSHLVRELPNNFAASVCVVQHLAPFRDTFLVEILNKQSKLPVRWAEQGEPLQRAHIFVAPSDTHLLFTDDHLRLSRSARENHSRPAIDKLFRSAAAEHGSRVVGVLLSGMLGDGVAGLCAIRDAGGKTVVQDPSDALFPDLPSRALQAMTPDHVVPLAELAALLVRTVEERVAPTAIPSDILLEAEIDRAETASPEQLLQLGPQSPISCPECNGPTWELGGPGARRFRCFLGHVVNARDLLARSVEDIELALWSAVRALHDRAETLEALARDVHQAVDVSTTYRKHAAEAREQAEVARRFILQLTQE